jgi:ubiquinol-cytochrome c reductase cytochrome c subunit
MMASRIRLTLRWTGLAVVALFTGSLFLSDTVGASTAMNNAPKFTTTRANTGTPNADQVTPDGHGGIASYGSSAITYQTPAQILGISPAELASLGQALYTQNCASCHGTHADGNPAPGTPGVYPNLVGVGPATVTFWIESGRMPAMDTTQVQAPRRASRLTDRQALAIAQWVNSLQNGYPYVPTVHLNGGDVTNGAALFAENCAACHTITGGGDALAYSTYAPSLHKVPVNQIAMAIRVGPGNMPNFTGNLTDSQVRDIVRYVATEIQHPVNRGGAGLGGLGPVAEGFVGLSLGVGVLALFGFWVGERQ